MTWTWRGALAVLLGLAGQCANAQYGEVVRCESFSDRTEVCEVDTRGGVNLVEQHSRTACIEGRTWGTDRRGIWVSNGCRATFEVYSRPMGGDNIVLCESFNDRESVCGISPRSEVRLLRQKSRSACVEGSTWGVDRRGLWVTRGCRGEFEVLRRGGGGHYGDGYPNNRPSRPDLQTISCESHDDRYRKCNVRIPREAILIDQKSRSECVYMRTWGYDRNGVWVDRGCRGEFEIR
ncbi:MAG: DUF3011 domain-containing protein [Lysobacteraceae bacterium]